MADSKGTEPTIGLAPDTCRREAAAKAFLSVSGDDGGEVGVVHEHFGSSLLEVKYLEIKIVAAIKLDVKTFCVKIVTCRGASRSRTTSTGS
jgi:hypothetical protein